MYLLSVCCHKESQMQDDQYNGIHRDLHIIIKMPHSDASLRELIKRLHVSSTVRSWMWLELDLGQVHCE